MTATLADVLRLVAELETIVPMGRRGRTILHALANTAHDVKTMTGLVINGRAHDVRAHQEWAICGCRDDAHTFSRDGYFGRSYWMQDEAYVTQKAATSGRHVVTRHIAATVVEVVP